MKSTKHLKLSEQESRNIRGLLNRNTRVLPNGCIEWTAGFGNGYPALWTGERKLQGHRAVAALEGELTSGQLVRHLCHNKSCLNPSHLQLGTDKDNGQDESSKHLHDNKDLYLKAKKLVNGGFSVMSACYRVGLPYSSLTRRIINETCC